MFIPQLLNHCMVNGDEKFRKSMCKPADLIQQLEKQAKLTLARGKDGNVIDNEYRSEKLFGTDESNSPPPPINKNFKQDEDEAEEYLDLLLKYISDWAENDYARNLTTLYKKCKRELKINVRQVSLTKKKQKSKKTSGKEEK